MSERSLKESISRLIRAALLEQDAATYHGKSTMTGENADELTATILKMVKVEVNSDKINDHIRKRVAGMKSEETTPKSPEQTILNVSWYIPGDGTENKVSDPVWPNNWPVPRVGDDVVLKDGRSLKVSAVDWFPHGEDGSEPFVYIVLKSPDARGLRGAQGVQIGHGGYQINL